MKKQKAKKKTIGYFLIGAIQAISALFSNSYGQTISSDTLNKKNKLVEVMNYSDTAKASADKIWYYYENVHLWPEWDEAMKWGKINGKFEVGNKGIFKTKMGMKIKFELISVTPNVEFASVSPMMGAIVYVYHDLEKISENETRITHRVYMGGFMKNIWLMMFNKNLPKKGVKKIIQLVENK